MKPFNLEEAKAGKPVGTIGGSSVTFLSFDMKNPKPIVALIHDPNWPNQERCEAVVSYDETGINSEKWESDEDDLCMIQGE